MAENDQPLQREIDEVTRIWDARYGAFQEKLKEYAGAVEEEKRLNARVSDLEKQIEEAKKQVEVRVIEISRRHSPLIQVGIDAETHYPAIEQDIKPQLALFKSAARSGEVTASAANPIGLESITANPNGQRWTVSDSEEIMPSRDPFSRTARLTRAVLKPERQALRQSLRHRHRAVRYSPNKLYSERLQT